MAGRAIDPGASKQFASERRQGHVTALDPISQSRSDDRSSTSSENERTSRQRELISSRLLR